MLAKIEEGILKLVILLFPKPEPPKEAGWFKYHRSGHRTLELLRRPRAIQAVGLNRLELPPATGAPPASSSDGIGPASASRRVCHRC